MNSEAGFVFSGEKTEDDVASGYLEYLSRVRPVIRSQWHEGLTALALLLVAIAVVVVFMGLVTPYGSDLLPLLIFAICAGYIAGLGLWARSTKDMAKRVVRLSTAEVGPLTVIFRPDALVVRMTDGIVTEAPWSQVSQIDFAPETILIWHDPLTAHRLPRRLVGGEAREAELVAALRQWAPHTVEALASGI